eukprot:jgi/Tetstr1/437243/TSEL_025973.t1
MVEQLGEAIAATISQRINTPPELHHAQWLKDTITMSEFDPSELLIHPFSQTIREAGELGGNTGHNHIRRAAICMHKKARKTAPTSLALRAAGRAVYTLTLHLTAHHHSIIGGTRGTDRTEQWRKTVTTAPTASAATAMPGAHADDEEELELNYEENDNAMEVDTAQRAATETPGAAESEGGLAHAPVHMCVA